MSDLEKLEEENRRLRSSIEELSILNEISTAINSTMALDNIIGLIVQKCVKHLKAEQASVMLLDKQHDESAFRTMIRKADHSVFSPAYHLDGQITGWMLTNKKPLIVNDLPNDTRFNKILQEGISICNLISVPLFFKGKMTGIISVFNKKGSELFTPDDERLLSIIASESAQVIENARLLKEEQTLISMMEEMRLATQIQADLLPKEIPAFEGYQISGVSIPARSVGGDYYDFIKMDDSKVAFCIADVSGKGMPAALLMANIQASIRGQAFFKTSCHEAVSFTNNLLYASTDSSKYATLCYCILDTGSGSLSFCNAGHNPPILFSPGKQSLRLKDGGIVAGMIPEFRFSENSVELSSGDLLVLFTDGVTEAMNTSEEEFGEERLAQIISSSIDESSDNILSNILSEVKLFAKGTEQFDDITVLVIKRMR
ncbi:MAG: GAF domain-containing SpoIIE family protein phosphatase [Syntrophomonadaceae bacterium]